MGSEQLTTFFLHLFSYYSSFQEVKCWKSGAMVHVCKLKQEDHLSPVVRDHFGERNETLYLKKRKEKFGRLIPFFGLLETRQVGPEVTVPTLHAQKHGWEKSLSSNR